MKNHRFLDQRICALPKLTGFWQAWRISMNSRNIGIKIVRQKKIIIGFLYLGTLIIIFLGAFFAAFSVLNHISLKVLNASVPGIVFGVLVIYLGLRYFFMVSEFKQKFYSSTANFSWSNFRREKRKGRLVVQKK